MYERDRGRALGIARVAVFKVSQEWLRLMRPDGLQIPELSTAPLRQVLEAILRPIAYYRRC